MIAINDTPCKNYSEQAEQMEIDEYLEDNKNDIEEQKYYERDWKNNRSIEDIFSNILYCCCIIVGKRNI